MNTGTIDSELGSNKIYFREGNPTVLFLSGWDSFYTKNVFSPIIDRLDQSLGFLTFDYLNTGESSLAKKDYALTDQTLELAKYIKQSNIDKIIIAAHSIGGVFALRLAKQLDNVIGMVLIEPTTQEVILNPPNNKEYNEMMHQYDDMSPEEIENMLKVRVYKYFDANISDLIWSNYKKSSQKTPQFDCIDFAESITNNNDFKLDDHIKSVIFTEEYRNKEFEQSEYYNKDSTIINLGDNHYLYWQFQDEIAKIINKLAI